MLRCEGRQENKWTWEGLRQLLRLQLSFTAVTGMTVTTTTARLEGVGAVGVGGGEGKESGGGSYV